MLTRCSARKPAVPHVNPLFCMWAGLPRLGIAGPRADEEAQARNSGFACDVAGLVYGCAPCPARKPAVPHVNPLFRTWAGLPRLGIAGPRADEEARVRNSGFACDVVGLVYGCASCSARKPAVPHVNPLFCMWAGLPRLGIAGSRADEMARVRNSGFACDVVGLVYGCAPCSAGKPPVPHVNPLFRMWAGSPRLGIAGSRADEEARVRNSGFACDVAGLVYGCAPCSAHRPPVPHVGGVAQARNSGSTCG